MTTLARLSFYLNADEADAFAMAYERQLAPILKRHGLQPAAEANGLQIVKHNNTMYTSWMFSQCFAFAEPAAVFEHARALKQDPDWQHALRRLSPIFCRPHDLLVHRIGIYSTPAGRGQRVPAGPGQTVKAGAGTARPAGSGFRQGPWQSFGLLNALPNCLSSLIQDRHGALWFATCADSILRGRPQGLWRYDGYNLHQFTRQDGLPHDAVTCVLEDPAGSLWIGTRAGVCRYDGHRFIIFTAQDGLVDDRVLALLIDRQEHLWIGTRSGVSRYDGASFTTWTARDGLAQDPVGCMLEDRAGQLWFGNGWALEGWAVSRYDGQAFTNFSEPDGLGGDHTLSLLEDRSGRLWLGHNNSVSCYDGQTFTVPVLTDRSQHSGGVMAIREDRQGQLWFAVFGEGLRRYDGHRFTPFTPQDGLVGTMVTDLLEDREGQLWAGFNKDGLSCYTGQRLATYRIEDGLSHNLIYELLLDQQGRLWVTTHRGVSCYDGHRFQALESTIHWQSRHLLAQRGGPIWFGLMGKGCGRWDGQQVEIFSPERGKYNRFFERTMPLLEDRQGQVWFVSTEEEGRLLRWDGSQWTPFAADIGLAQHQITCMLEDRAGHLWFGGNGGISCYDGQSATCFSAEDGLAPGAVTCLLEDRQGRLWVGSEGGLSRYDDTGLRGFTGQDGLAPGAVTCLLEDRQGRLWIGSEGGLSCYEGTDLRCFTAAAGLAHDEVTCLLEDDRGQLWIGTEGGGVARFDGGVFQYLSRQDGLAQNSISQIRQDAQGGFWIGTSNGLHRYWPASTPPQVQLQAIVADRIYQPDETVQIPAGQKTVTFEFQGISLTTLPERMAYVCQLVGRDADWQSVYSGRVTYQDLPIGDHLFRVKAVDQDLNYSEIAEVALSVEPDALVESLTNALGQSSPQGQFIGRSEALGTVQAHLRQAASSPLTVLIHGETGSGKGLAARFVHDQSFNRNGPYIQVTCGALPQGLVESELFGHEKGAFTGAHHRKLGKVELAKDGTLFLDEIGDLSLEAQAKVLRLLEEGTFERVGGTETLTVSTRIVAATNRDLETMVAEGTFREDLYFRLKVLPVSLPPLRQRREDIPLLALYFMQQMAAHLNKPVAHFTPAALDAMQAYGWPGNVRELEHTVQRAVILCPKTTIRLEDLSLDHPATAPARDEEILPLEEVERRHILQVLAQTDWVVRGPQGAAALLGLPRSTLYSRMAKLGIQRPQTPG